MKPQINEKTKLPGIFKRFTTCIAEWRLPSALTHFWSELESKLSISGKKFVFCKRGKRKILWFKVNDIPRGNFMLTHVCYVKDHFPKLSAYLDFKINTYDTVIDIGANLGYFSMYAANIAKEGKVYCLEPSTESFERLKYHQKLNKMINTVLIKKGVSDKDEKTKLYLWKNFNARHSMIYRENDKSENYELVDCIPLKQVFDEYKIEKCDFLKIDCEGMEHKILQALPEEYFKRIKKISLEYHKNIEVLELAKLLYRRNYKVVINGYPERQGHVYALRHSENRVQQQI